MGQKVNPIGLRIGILGTWSSKWFSRKKDYAKLVYNDFLIRKYIKAVALSNENISLDTRIYLLLKNN